VWWADLLWGFWNGITAWIVLIVHVFGGWEQFPIYNEARSGNWYVLGTVVLQFWGLCARAREGEPKPRGIPRPATLGRSRPRHALSRAARQRHWATDQWVGQVRGQFRRA